MSVCVTQLNYFSTHKETHTYTHTHTDNEWVLIINSGRIKTIKKKKLLVEQQEYGQQLEYTFNKILMVRFL